MCNALVAEFVATANLDFTTLDKAFSKFKTVGPVVIKSFLTLFVS